MKLKKFSGWNQRVKSNGSATEENRRRRGTRKRTRVNHDEFQFELLEKRQLLAANVFISEFLASNNNGLKDGFGIASDWIEIHNSGDVAQDLAGWHLTDNAVNLGKWTFPTGTSSVVNPGAYLVVFASSVGVPDPTGKLHTNFSLSAGGEYLALTRPDLSVVSEYGAGGTNFPPQTTDVSYGLQSSGGTIQYIDADEEPGGNTSNLPGGWVRRGAGAGAAESNFANNGGALEAPGSSSTNVNQLSTTVALPNTSQSYDAFAFFWDDVPGTSWGLQAGLNSTNLANWDINTPGVFVIDASTQTAGSNQRITGLNVLGQTGDSNGYSDWIDGNRKLYAAPLGTVSGQSNLTVFADHLTGAADRTWYDGIGYRAVDQTQVIRYFPTPTPGAANGVGVEGFVADTKFSLNRGFYNAPFSLAITTATPSAQIYYTTDGSFPSASNSAAVLYTAPLNITVTTNLRAAAYFNGFLPTNSDTQSYIFLNQIVQQNPLGVAGGNVSPNNGLVYPAIWQGPGGTPADGGVPDNQADYELDPNVVNSPAHNDSAGNTPTDIGIRAALQALPSISLTLPHANFFAPLSAGNSAGIAVNAQLRTEYPGSFEYFDPNTGQNFQFNATIEAHGNASRDNVRLKKHSYRVTFNGVDGGPSKLTVPIFNNSSNNDINSVVLRASFTDDFATRTSTNRYNPIIATQLRDVFFRDTTLDMGGIAPASTYAHLYINGLYWGLYNPAERPDDDFLEANVGGLAADWDIVRGQTSGDGVETYRGARNVWDQLLVVANTISTANATTANSLYYQIQGKFANGSNDPGTAALLDADSLIDSIMLHQFSGVEDWPKGNWYAARNRVDPETGFKFIPWDQEIAYDQLYRDRTEDVGTGISALSPGALYLKLRNSSEFRLRFADRVQKHFFNDGQLTTAANQARWTEWVNRIEPGIVGESARWGDAREGQTIVGFSSNGPAGTTPQIPTGSRSVGTLGIIEWRNTVNWIRDRYFTEADDVYLARLISDNLFTTFAAPTFAINGTNQHGGSINSGSNLSMTGGTGTIYFTLDGSDPRTGTGGISGATYAGPIALSATTTVNARVRNGTTWSPLSTATFNIAANTLVISELNYNPFPATAAEKLVNPALTADDFEFVELYNFSTTTSINLQNMKLADGITYTFGATTLAAGQRIVVAKNPTALALRYGSGINLATGTFTGKLSDGGENIQLLDALDAEIMSVNYDDTDPWYEQTDGVGATLVLNNPTATATNLLGKYYSWRGSVERGGSPGAAGLAPRGVVVNEIRSSSTAPQTDAIELFNPTAAAINIGGWYISDSGNNPLKYQIAANTMLGAGQYLVFDESQFNPGGAGFALDGTLGDQVYLTRTGVGGQILYEHVAAFNATFNGDSLGRLPNGSGRLTRLTASSFGLANTANPKVGPLVISEVNYHPANPSAAALAIEPTMIDNDLEFIEIHNPTGAAINNAVNWRIRGAVDIDFSTAGYVPAGGSIPAGGNWVVVSFNPTLPANANRLAAFRTHYGVGAGVKIVGGFSGSLSNSSGRISLQQPDAPRNAVVPYVTVDEVVYDDLVPWANADGTGNSLHRISISNNGNLAGSWNGIAPTPGTTNLAAAPPQIARTVRDGSPLNANGFPSGTPLVRPDLWSAYSVVFNEPVSASAGSLQMTNATLGGSAVSLIGIAFSYNSATFTATWNLSGLATPLNAGFYDVVLNGNSITSVASGLALDGDGNGSAGGNYQQRIYKAIPGDANLDGDVDVSQLVFPANVGDLVTVKASLGTTSGAKWAQGDFNGDGDVDVSQLVFPNNVGDLSILYANLGRNVRPPAGNVSGISLIVGSGVIVPVIGMANVGLEERGTSRLDLLSRDPRTTNRISTTPLALGGSILVSFEKPLPVAAQKPTEPPAKIRQRDRFFAQLNSVTNSWKVLEATGGRF